MSPVNTCKSALAAALLAAVSPVQAQLTEDSAKQAAQELRLLVTEGTNVIGDLQPAINSGKQRGGERRLAFSGGGHDFSWVVFLGPRKATQRPGAGL